MIMGSLLIISGCLLYWLLKPPVPNNSIIQEEFVLSKNSSLDVEALAGYLTSQPYTR